MLLLAHLDVVEAKREDWERDPFKLIEENGYFYARGASDDKAMAAVFVANLIRYRQEGYKPDRDIILALTADEEIIPSKFSGVEYLLKNHRNLIDAEFALNEGGSGLLDGAGKYVLSRHPGRRKGVPDLPARSHQPRRAQRAAGQGQRHLPISPTGCRGSASSIFRSGCRTRRAPISSACRAIETGQVAADMKAILRDPPDPQASRACRRIRSTTRPTAPPAWRRCSRRATRPTRCRNARARRRNCRILPGEPVESVQKTLARVMADDKIRITPEGEPTLSPPPPLTREILGPVEAVSAQMWPGVPVVPTMLVAATDGRFLNNAGIPTYGISGMFRDPDGSGRARAERAHPCEVALRRSRISSVWKGWGVKASKRSQSKFR